MQLHGTRAQRVEDSTPLGRGTEIGEIGEQFGTVAWPTRPAVAVSEVVQDPSLVKVVPRWLRFVEVNPFTGTTYTRSLFGDLPGYAAHVVTEVLDLTPWVWDALIRSGEVHEVVADYVRYPVADWLAWVARRQTRPAQDWECDQCWGTCVTFDGDGSFTGTIGTPVLCWCVQANLMGGRGRYVVQAPGRTARCGW